MAQKRKLSLSSLPVGPSSTDPCLIDAIERTGKKLNHSDSAPTRVIEINDDGTHNEVLIVNKQDIPVQKETSSLQFRRSPYFAPRPQINGSQTGLPGHERPPHDGPALQARPPSQVRAEHSPEMNWQHGVTYSSSQSPPAGEPITHSSDGYPYYGSHHSMPHNHIPQNTGAPVVVSQPSFHGSIPSSSSSSSSSPHPKSSVPQHPSLDSSPKASPLGPPMPSSSEPLVQQIEQDAVLPKDSETSVSTESYALPPPPPPPPSEPPLSKEQKTLVNLILSGRNVFYTGSAGCGKSTVLKAFVKRMTKQGFHVDIIAPTGRAALDINGSTFWTYAGWNPDSMKKPLEELNALALGKFVQKRLSRTDVLVIDEISMMENHHFERLNSVMQSARYNKKPFGGVQLIVTGDFCQLPPVKPFKNCITCGKTLMENPIMKVYKCPSHGEFADADKWAFRSDAWDKCQFEHVNLTKIHRQSDQVFINILEKCRMGKPFSDNDTKILLDHECNVKDAVKLFSTREEVRRINLEAFGRLPAPKRVFTCYDDIQLNPEHRNLASKTQRNPMDNSLVALRDHRFDTRIELKAGMLVVLLVNLDITLGLVNGSQGMIIGWEDQSNNINNAYDGNNSTNSAAAAAAPQRPKASMSVTFQQPTPPATDPAAIQTSSIIPSLTGDYAELRERNINTFLTQCERPSWPIVRFSNGITRPIRAHCTVNEIGDTKPYTLLSRAQIPLLAAWAMSIHKAQGMTLSRVVVDLSRSFEDGQTYVALSRARDLKGLKVEGLGKWRGNGDETVRAFLSERLGVNV